MLEIKGITKLFSSNDGRSVCALDNFSIEIKRGSLVVLMGPNGSGKTTLFRILDGQLIPEGGSVSWDGTSLSACHSSLRVAHVPQEPRALAFPEMTLEEHLVLVEMAGRTARFWVRGITSSRRRQYRGLLESFGLDHLAGNLSSPLKTLSVGWQQIFTLVMAAAGQSLNGHRNGDCLLLLDEPTSALDIENAKICLDMVRRLQREGHTILFTTHEPTLALEMAERLCLIKQGRLVTDLAANEVKQLGLKDLWGLLAEGMRVREPGW
jgi:ABC-type multidrug transport system ATPase subunit